MTSDPDIAAAAPVMPVADLHVASTQLGFPPEVAPAPGAAVAYLGQHYLIVDVVAAGNGPTFSGGSRFVITTSGGSLQVGLRVLDDRERQVATAARK